MPLLLFWSGWESKNIQESFIFDFSYNQSNLSQYFPLAKSNISSYNEEILLLVIWSVLELDCFEDRKYLSVSLHNLVCIEFEKGRIHKSLYRYYVISWEECTYVILCFSTEDLQIFQKEWQEVKRSYCYSPLLQQTWDMEYSKIWITLNSLIASDWLFFFFQN